MQITVNGEPRSIENGTSVAALLTALAKNPKLCAVERNRELVPRRDHAQCVLSEGDVVEIVTLVGGG